MALSHYGNWHVTLWELACHIMGIGIVTLWELVCHIMRIGMSHYGNWHVTLWELACHIVGIGMSHIDDSLILCWFSDLS